MTRRLPAANLARLNLPELPLPGRSPTVPTSRTVSPRRRTALAAAVDGPGPTRRRALRARIATVLRTLGNGGEGSTLGMIERLEQTLDEAGAAEYWLALSVLSGVLPSSDDVLRTARKGQLDGPLRAIGHLLVLPFSGGGRRPTPWREVHVVTDEVLVDLHHTAETALATGIQRVARQTVARWHRDHRPRLVHWDPRLHGLCDLTEAQAQRALTGGTDADVPPTAEDAPLVVPWKATYLLPELLVEPPRAQRLKAMLTWSGSRSAMIGFDCVPISSAETVRAGMGANYAGMLSAAVHCDVISPISEAAGTEYRGWRTMLDATGQRGPRIEVAVLPTEVRRPTDDEVEAARQELLTSAGLDDLPLVLCVGSHEPRKNHLAVLQAAERLWQEGRRFSLLHVGGNSWRSERFQATAQALQAAGRPLLLRSSLPDAHLMSAYALARCTVFPSLNEGYGLPVAESLTLGVPVLTSAYGSMREIAEAGGGALLVDPRDDTSVTDGLRALLTDDELHARLTAQARTRPPTTWDDYAARTWACFTGAPRSHR